MSDRTDARTPEAERPLEAHVIHPSLYRAVHFAGAEPAVVVLEVTTAFGLVFGVGFHVATLALAVFYLTVVHGIMVWVAKQDPQMSALYVRSLSARDFYAPHGSVRSAPPTVHSAIPRES
jgi:type IV secretory pathway TrbD component